MKRALAFALPALALAACQTATPEKVLRMEEGPAPEATICARMADDFAMVLVEGNETVGRLYRVSLAGTFFSARGVSWGFRARDEIEGEACQLISNGTACEMRGPASLLIRSNAGQAQYQIADGQKARVWSEGAILQCRELK